MLICNGDLVPLALFAPLIILDPNPTLPYPYAPFSVPAVPSLSDNDPAGGLIGAASKLLVSLADVESLHVDVLVDIAGRGVGEEGPREFDDFLKGRLNGMVGRGEEVGGWGGRSEPGRPGQVGSRCRWERKEERVGP